ncbi:MAG: terminase small subunit, partial [Marinomonas sp.]
MARPPKYKTPEEMQAVIDDYFNGDAWVELDGKPMLIPTVEGLAYTLGLSRQGLNEYSGKKEFSDTVKRAKQRIAIALEQKLWSNNVTGAIFNLKNNFGWKDKQEIESKNTHEHSIKDLDNLSDEELAAIATGRS